MSSIAKKILIIEDEKPLRTALIDKFNREGFTVIEAKDGEEGLKVALEEKPDLIFLDIIMPTLNGMEMLKKLRAENSWGANVPVIMFTNLTSEDEDRLKDIIETKPAYYLVKSETKMEKVIELTFNLLNIDK